ncbi:RNA methyltransferase [Azovibrio restrictus]|uniref:RNA methyltransferase n=1 Tax=Azovibrio restrictus TaxID=146938 RepID=UPI0026F1A97D|nr:RNA methyltransferase [Azovibrio restrictus]
MNPTDALARISIVLSRTSHPGNIGSVARAMKTMGLTRLVLVAPRRFPDPEADTLASGASDILASARVVESLDEALADSVFSLAVSARSRELGPPPLLARQGAARLVAQAGEGAEVALVFGNETSGLSNAEVQRCHGAVMIAANPDFSSLNLAAAVQVLCYELRLAAHGDAPPVPARTTPFASPPATHQEQEGFYRHLEQVMVDSGFLDPAQPKRLMPKLRRLFGRAGLERDEVNILRGVLSAVQVWRK